MICFQKKCDIRRSDQVAAECIVGHHMKAGKRIEFALSVVGLVLAVARSLMSYAKRRRGGLVRALAVPFSAIGIIAGASAMALLCVSCSTPLLDSLEIRQAYVASRDLNDTVREAILAGRVVPGMTMEDVYATWGHPSETDTSETLGPRGPYGKEVWIYGSFLSLTPEAEVFFRNGVVYSVSPEYLSDVPLD